MSLLEAVGLTRTVGDRALFRGLSLSVDEGEVLGIRAPSGAGKTLLLRLLAWLDPPDAGDVRLAGRPVDAWGPTAWRARVTYVPQHPPNLPGTPADLAGRVAAFASQQGRGAEDPVALSERWGLPRDAWDRPWHRLSGGERQRALLALAVSRDPVVLLLDEPTSALDPDAEARVEADLTGRTAVWVTHDAAQAARVADRVRSL